MNTNTKNTNEFIATVITLSVLCRVKGAGEAVNDAAIFFPTPREGGGFDLVQLQNDCFGKWMNFPRGTTITLTGFFGRTDTYLCAVQVPGQAKPLGLVVREASWQNLVAAANGGSEKQKEREAKREGKGNPERDQLLARIAELEKLARGASSGPKAEEPAPAQPVAPEVKVEASPTPATKVRPGKGSRSETKSVEDLLSE